MMCAGRIGDSAWESSYASDTTREYVQGCRLLFTK